MLAVQSFFLAIMLTTGTVAQQCNQGGSSFSCKDAQAACNTVKAIPIPFGLGETNKQIGVSGSVQVWLMRVASSGTEDNMNELCNEIIQSCCNDQSKMQKSSIALQPGEEGSVQIFSA
ncbi:hypothetical protein BD410DRAFT_116008 [Rickenella mellea]|uniref:Hydrophobin n=1 Tax=Rickenella mellea TaxID=50990 RepID=A0A4Y7QBU2_9AGAM|nr:hypothetical protein BD410DRAFT_116008 [Rickenella mellea]